MAKGYYKLPDNAKWVDTLKCIVSLFSTYPSQYKRQPKFTPLSSLSQMADETHHRDVNHTFADMKSDDANPFVINHKGNLKFMLSPFPLGLCAHGLRFINDTYCR